MRGIIGLWHLLVIAVLTALFTEQLFAFNIGSALSWARLIMSACMLIASFFIYPYLIPKKSILDKAYVQHLKRKNKEILELRKQKELIMNTAMKQAKKTQEISHQARKLAKNIDQDKL